MRDKDYEDDEEYNGDDHSFLCEMNSYVTKIIKDNVDNQIKDIKDAYKKNVINNEDSLSAILERLDTLENQVYGNHKERLCPRCERMNHNYSHKKMFTCKYCGYCKEVGYTITNGYIQAKHK